MTGEADRNKLRGRRGRLPRRSFLPEIVFLAGLLALVVLGVVTQDSWKPVGKPGTVFSGGKTER